MTPGWLRPEDVELWAAALVVLLICVVFTTDALRERLRDREKPEDSPVEKTPPEPPEEVDRTDAALVSVRAQLERTKVLYDDNDD